MQNDTVCRLAQVDGIVGVKDATGDMNRGTWLLHDLATKNLSHFQVYSGDDPTAMSYLFLGAKGNISVTANVAPKQMALLCRLAMNNEHKAAIELNNRLLHLHKYLFCEPNPIPVKWAMARLSLLKNHLRLPLTPLLKTHESTIEYALKVAGLLN
jgi:4-hydroxy-tetrahydrodipicolinate synthase